MIKTRKDYRRYLQLEHRHAKWHSFWFLYLHTMFKPTQRFLLLLRTCEYLRNTNRFVNQPIYLVAKWLKYRCGVRLGFSIPENVAGEGLQLPHYGTIVIHANARLGKHCRLHVCVNIGASGGDNKAPQIGDYVYLGPGAKVYGDIRIADRIAISANAAVSKSFLRSDRMIGGVPAVDIKEIDIRLLIND